MKAKKEFILLFIVIVALIFYLVSRNANKTHYEIPDIPEIAEKDISKIEISKANTSIILNKKDNEWLIAPEEYLADTSKIESMLKVIEEFELTTLVSEKKSEHLFDLTDDKKIIIKVWADEILKLDFEMGRPAPSWNHTFVKMPGDIGVYHAKGNFKSKFDLTVDMLRDKAVLSFDQNEIEGIEIIKGKESIVLAKKAIPPEPEDQGEDKEKVPFAAPPTPTIAWEDPDGKQADEPVISSMLSALSNLTCENYMDNQEKKTDSDAIYTIKLKGIKEYMLSIYNKAVAVDKTYPAISSENDYPFLLSDAQADKIMKSPVEITEEVKEK